MKILFGVFDWGLGHATRDIPLIEQLLEKGHSVDILSTGRAMIFLKQRFGKRCKYHDVPSISVPYPEKGIFAVLFAAKIPRMLYDLEKARSLSEKIIRRGGYDKVITDCRYDVYDRVENSYLINHQVRFKAPFVAEHILEAWLSYMISKYKYVIVPDFKENSLSGELSHNMRFLKKERIKYIGILSQIRKLKVKEDIDYFITISGPEPQRTVFEEKIMAFVPKLKGKVFITLGKPEVEHSSSDGRITTCGYLDSRKQQEIMNRAKFIICRSGYSTVMDIVELGKTKVLFVPTLGQTEQEHLSDIYEKKGYFHSVSQRNIDLINDIQASAGYKGYKPKWRTKESVGRFMDAIGL